MEEGFGPRNVTEFRFRCLLLKSETSTGRNRKIALIRRPATWGEGKHVQGILKSLLKHHSSKGLILWCSGFFMVQISYPYMTTGRTIALTIWTFVGKVMSLLFIG